MRFSSAIDRSVLRPFDDFFLDDSFLVMMVRVVCFCFGDELKFVRELVEEFCDDSRVDKFGLVSG